MNAVIVVMMGLVASAHAFQPKFEIEYTNHAWGYVNQGCLVDEEGNIYKYAYGHASDGKGLVPAGKMSAADLVFAEELTEKASKGKYTQRNAAFDAGTTEWTARTDYGLVVKLQAQGDVSGQNDAPEAKQLVQLLNGLCQQPQF